MEENIFSRFKYSAINLDLYCTATYLNLSYCILISIINTLADNLLYSWDYLTHSYWIIIDIQVKQSNAHHQWNSLFPIWLWLWIIQGQWLLIIGKLHMLSINPTHTRSDHMRDWCLIEGLVFNPIPNFYAYWWANFKISMPVIINYHLTMRFIANSLGRVGDCYFDNNAAENSKTHWILNLIQSR